MRIEREKNGEFHIVLSNGNFVRDTNCEIWSTRDAAKAEEALAFLTGTARRDGARWLKSTFGVF